MLLSALWGLVNNAAINARGDLEITSMDYIRRVTDVNILGTIMVTKMFLPMIRKRQGKIYISILAAQLATFNPLTAGAEYTRVFMFY